MTSRTWSQADRAVFLHLVALVIEPSPAVQRIFVDHLRATLAATRADSTSPLFGLRVAADEIAAAALTADPAQMAILTRQAARALRPVLADASLAAARVHGFDPGVL